MSYTAQVFNIMIASPGDVASERAIIRDVIYEWNAVHSSTRKKVLLPVGWETHSSPEMGASAQGIINRQVLDKGRSKRGQVSTLDIVNKKSSLNCQ